MPSVSSVSPTGDPYVDGVLSGIKWGVNSLTFSFPTDPSFYGSNYGSGEPANNFAAFNLMQQAAVRSILGMTSSFANLTFTEVVETSSVHGDLRFAESDSPSTAWAYFPSTSAAGGDAWFNNSKGYYNKPLKGNYAYHTMMHEIGHALGLKHPQDARGSFGAMPLDHDSVEYTVMSYRSYVGGPTNGYTVGSGSYPQSLMMYDIAALQAMYGANYATNSGNTVYSWSPTTGEWFIDGVGQGAPVRNKIFMTIWDGGGRDVYDFSNYASDLKLDLNPGAWTTVSATQLASLGNGHIAAGNIANALLYKGNPASLIEDAIGGAGNDTIIGNEADNHLTGGGGNDLLDGGLGIDTAIYTGLSADYFWEINTEGGWFITDLRAGSPDGFDTLFNVEYLQFLDTLIALSHLDLVVVNDVPVITSPAWSAQITEWADKSAEEVADTPHTADGTIAFSDDDVLDFHTASFAAQGSGYLGHFSLAAVDQNLNSVGWSFTVADSAMDYLKSGQSLTQLYDVTIDDGRGGVAVQTVTITLYGADDLESTSTKTSPGLKKGKKSGASDVQKAKADVSGMVSAADKAAIIEDQAPLPHPQDSFAFPLVGAQAGGAAPLKAQAAVHLPSPLPPAEGALAHPFDAAADLGLDLAPFTGLPAMADLFHS